MKEELLCFILEGTFCFILCEFVQSLKCVKLLSHLALTKLGTFIWNVSAYKMCRSTTHSLHFGLNRSGKVMCSFLQVVCVYIEVVNVLIFSWHFFVM